MEDYLIYSDLENRLINEKTLVDKDDIQIWVTFNEIETKIKEGFKIYSDAKRALYESMEGEK